HDANGELRKRIRSEGEKTSSPASFFSTLAPCRSGFGGSPSAGGAHGGRRSVAGRRPTVHSLGGSPYCPQRYLRLSYVGGGLLPDDARPVRADSAPYRLYIGWLCDLLVRDRSHRSSRMGSA